MGEEEEPKEKEELKDTGFRPRSVPQLDIAAMLSRAVSQSGTVPQLEEPVRLLKPSPVVGTYPHGLAGLCLVCARMPCSYLKARILRALLAEAEYSKP